MDKKIILNLVFVYLSAVNSVHKDSINYMGDFVQISYDKQGNSTNITALSKDKSDVNISQHHFEIDSEKEYNLQSILSGFTNALTNILKNHKHTKVENQYNASLDIKNKTHIFVNAFRLYNMTLNPENSTQSIIVKGNVTNLSDNVTTENISDVEFTFTEAPIELTVPDRMAKSIFSKMTVNNLLTGSISNPVTKNNQEKQNISTTSTETATIITHNETREIERDSMNLFYRTSNIVAMEDEKMTKNLKDQETILSLPIQKNIDLLDKITKNLTMSENHYTKVEDISLEDFLNGPNMAPFENASFFRNDLRKIRDEEVYNLTNSKFEREAVRDFSETTTVTQKSVEDILNEYVFVPTANSVQSSEETIMEVNLLDILKPQTVISTTESSKPLTTSMGSTSTSAKPSSTVILTTATTTTPNTMLSTIDTPTNKTGVVLMVPTTFPEIKTPSPSEVSLYDKDLFCKNTTAPPVINDMKWINVDQILILMPMLTRVESNNSVVQNVTEKAPKLKTNISQMNTNNSKTSSLSNHPMNKIRRDKEMQSKFDPKEILKRDKENELYDDTIDLDDILDDDNTTDYLGIDYVDYYKDVIQDDLDTTTESNYTDVELIKNEVEHNLLEYALQSNEGVNNQYARSVLDCHGNATTMPDAVFPWIVTIFRKNGDSDQFEYFCDGVLLNNKAVLTSARCVSSAGSDAPNQLIVILGKRNLKIMYDGEVVIRVSQLYIHPSFTQPSSGSVADDDLAIIILDSMVPSSSSIRAACLDCEDCGDVEQAATTGWALTGELTPIFFKKESIYESEREATKFSATYGLNVSVCPSHGGLYLVQRQGAWYVGGLSASDPNDRSLCIIRTLEYTSLRNYMNWINYVRDRN